MVRPPPGKVFNHVTDFVWSHDSSDRTTFDRLTDSVTNTAEIRYSETSILLVIYENIVLVISDICRCDHYSEGKSVYMLRFCSISESATYLIV